MAGIDKIYGTQKQYLELWEWLLEHQKPIKSRVGWSSKVGGKYAKILPTNCMYNKEGYDEGYRPIANFKEEINKWLKEKCPLDFVQARLKEQYGY